MLLDLIVPLVPAISLFLAITLQEISLPVAGWSVFRPDIVLICLFYWRLYRPDRCSGTLPFFFGLIVDILSGVPTGLNAISKTVLVILVGYFGQRLRATDFIYLLPIISIFVFIEESIQVMMMFLIGMTQIHWSLFFGRIVATTLVAPLVISLLIYIHRSWLEEM
ncbi:MAG: rod shape-determining protein MreD [Magnetococcus sp. DMHC-6]